MSAAIPSDLPHPRPAAGSVTGTVRAVGGPAPRGIDPAAPLRVRVGAVATPVDRRLQIRRSADVLRLTRVGGRVTGSVRIPVWPGGRLGVPGDAAGLHQLAVCRETTEAALHRLSRGLRPVPGLHLQSVAVSAGSQLRVLARLETPTGPLLVGGAGPQAAEDVLARLQAHPELAAVPSAQPVPGWVGRPLVLHPPVAAALLVGLSWVLRGPAAPRLDGRRVLPMLTVVEHPVEHPEGAPDDAGLPAGPWVLVDDGRVAAVRRDGTTGLPLGRAVWSHERQRLAEAGSFVLTVSSRGSEAPAAGTAAADALHLVACVEGIRRYHPDGRIRLVCLARDGASGPTFRVALSGRPLTLLRALVAVAGPPGTDSADQVVTTPPLVLPPAEILERSPDVRISAL